MKRVAHYLYTIVVGAGPLAFLGHPAPCSACYYEPLSLVLLQGTQLIEKIRESMLLLTVQVHT